MNQNTATEKQTGYSGSVPTDQTAQKPGFSESITEPSAFSKDVQELSVLSENVQEPHAFPDNDPECDSATAQDMTDHPNGRGQTILRCPRCGHHHE